MKNHELLDLIGEVNEDYIMEAGQNVTRPRFRWKALAACAACAALVAVAYPVYRASHPALHDYTVLEGGTLNTLEDIKAPSPDAGGGETGGEDIDGTHYDVTGDAPVQEAASALYDNFLKNSGLAGSPDRLPDWCGGIWIDNSYYPKAKLTVAIVDGSRTPELEAQIEGWCGGEVVFKDVKYSWSHLDQLMEPISEALDGTGICCGFGVDVTANCLGVDLYSDEDIPDAVLAELARLDPDGDAIRVRVFTQAMSTLTGEVKKGTEPVPGGATKPAAEPPEVEQAVPAVNDLPQAKYDAITEGQ